MNCYLMMLEKRFSDSFDFDLLFFFFLVCVRIWSVCSNFFSNHYSSFVLLTFSVLLQEIIRGFTVYSLGLHDLLNSFLSNPPYFDVLRFPLPLLCVFRIPHNLLQYRLDSTNLMCDSRLSPSVTFYRS